MFEHLIQLLILFFVIIDPPLSVAVFFAATQKMPHNEKVQIATLAIAIAAALAGVFLLIGEPLLRLFSISLDNFRVAGGIVLGILGARMALGKTAIALEDHDHNSEKALASVIATPLITGPACITSIIISAHDYGKAITGTAVSIILIITLVLLYLSTQLRHFGGKTTVQVLSTIMGLITLAWAVNFIRIGLGI